MPKGVEAPSSSSEWARPTEAMNDDERFYDEMTGLLIDTLIGDGGIAAELRELARRWTELNAVDVRNRIMHLANVVVDVEGKLERRLRARLKIDPTSRRQIRD